MCLRAEHDSDGSPVKTAACNENDTLQVTYVLGHF